MNNSIGKNWKRNKREESFINSSLQKRASTKSAMESRMDVQSRRRTKMLEGIFLVILLLYPLRHIHWGLDLWDTGYNYANFQYMGLDHMDPMWLFSTHLANVVGNILTRLPLGDSLVGMNFYTGLFVSALAVLGYWFCTRKLNIPPGLSFVGELAAISLCWSPTALLYNYLTYILFLGCVILLYLGLTREKMWYLFAAGICLGTNVLVRFSNLPEAALIVAVWAYDFIVSREQKRLKQSERLGEKHGSKAVKKIVRDRDEKSKGIGAVGSENGAVLKKCSSKDVGVQPEGAWKRGFRHTLWCLGGYLIALAILFAYIQIRYGIDNYIEGIMCLFAMTDKATDYKPQAMIMGIIGVYVENMYWVIRIGIFVIGGMILGGSIGFFTHYAKEIANAPRLKRVLVTVSAKAILDNCLRTVGVLLAAVMLVWLYLRDFCSLQFYSYGSMLRPGILFLMLTMFIAVIRIFHRNCPKEEKLISGMLILVILLTSIGSNNGVYPSLNNLFVAAPYTFWQGWRFVTRVKTCEWRKLVLNPFPAKCILIAFLAMFLFQSTLFGAEFVFVEATGAQEVTGVAENNEVLKGVKMSPERAQWMTEISAYVEEEQLQGREVILYGWLPSLSYYLQMPSAFNPWSDLDSYSVSRMQQDLQEVEDEIAEGTEPPVIIIEKDYWEYLNGGTEALKASGATEKKITTIEQDSKWLLIVEFMEKYGYEQTFINEKFAVYLAP